MTSVDSLPLTLAQWADWRPVAEIRDGLDAMLAEIAAKPLPFPDGAIEFLYQSMRDHGFELARLRGFYIDPCHFA